MSTKLLSLIFAIVPTIAVSNRVRGPLGEASSGPLREPEWGLLMAELGLPELRGPSGI